MVESDLDEEIEKTLLHLVASLLLVSNAVEINTLFSMDDVSIDEMAIMLVPSIIGVCYNKETSYCSGVL